MSDQKQKGHIGTEREVDAAVSTVLSKVQGVKSFLSSFVAKTEHSQVTWPSMLDSFATLSGQMSTLMKQLGSDNLPPLHNHVLLPLQVSSDKDPDLEKSTDGRVPILHHEVVPHYLRTKLDLDLEARERDLQEEARQKEADIKEDISLFNSMLSSALDRVNEARNELEEQRNKANVSQPNTSAETRKLVAAYLHGQGLHPLPPKRRAILAGRMVQVPPTAMVGRAAQMPSAGRVPPSMMGKAPSAMRTDMKQAVTAAVAPYSISSPLKNR